MHRKRKFPSIVATMVMIAASVGFIAVSGSASATDTNYATVTGHAAFSSDANNPDYWGDNCTDGGISGVDSYVLPDGTYTKVIVKAGSGEFANTIFAGPPKAGETVWADTNGNNAYDPGGQDGDKQISHIILCEGTPPPPPDKEATPAAPTFTEVCGTANDTYTIPSTEGVTYKVNGQVKATGTYAGSGTVTITAEAAEGYKLKDYSGPWSHVYTDIPCPQPPTDEQCPRGTTWSDNNNDGVVQSATECPAVVVPPPHPKPNPHPAVCHAPKTMVNGECVSTAVAETGLGNSSNMPVWDYALAALAALLFVPLGGLGLRRAFAKIRR